MGVHGLWRLIEPSGKPVPLETLENKVLAVDISIWLHQAVKGFQDSKGASVPNAHLLGIYHRVCKLLYFRIKPVFVFDGGVPALKKQTISKRTQLKARNSSEADKIQKQLLSTLLKHTAVSKVLTDKIEASLGAVSKVPSKPSKDDMYVLPQTTELDSTVSSSEDESYTESSTTDSSPTKNWDLHTIDMNSVHFKSLPVDVRHEILTDLKETRKQSSWGRIHELPKVSDDFSDYQMRRLLKRQAVQAALEDAEKEMGGKTLSLADLESLLKDQGVLKNQNVGNRIASDENTKYFFVKDIKKAMEEARKREEDSQNAALVEEKDTEPCDTLEIHDAKESTAVKTKADIEYEDDLNRAIALSLECEPSTSTEKISEESKSENVNPANFSFLENFTDADFASSSSDEEENVMEQVKSKMSSAQSYMMEYSGLTPNEIAKILSSKIKDNVTDKQKLKKANLATVPECDDNNTATTTPEKTKENNENTVVTVNKDKLEDTVEAVEIMSSSDTSDSEGDDKENKKISVVVDPNVEFNEDDDLFADVFESPTQKPEKEASETIGSSNSETVSKLEIVVNPSAKFSEEDDLFSDIFDKNENESSVESKVSELSPKGISETLSKSNNNTLLEDVQKSDHNENIAGLNVKIANPGEISSKESISDNLQDNDTKRNEADKKDSTSLLPDKKENDNTSNEAGTIKENLNRNIIQPKPTLSEAELRELKDQLQREKVDLINEKSTKERMAGTITDQMYQEAQELLELFGVPYIIAPMEAEAQCAFLDAIDLTDGTITDDSDIWLFGGRTVYKNFFNQSKYVMEFRSENIHHHFKLTREQMILLALLVGSDYTVGLQGVGPVTALEILAAFPPCKGKSNEFSLSHSELLAGLKEFRSWFTKGKSAGPGRSSLKSKLKNVSFTDNFPSVQVVQAYLDPKVETSREAFSWGRPNALALREFAREKFGWTKTKTEDILNPVLKKLEESRNQKSIKDYFKTRFKIHSGEVENKMSKRVKSAITNIGRDPSEILVDELQDELKKHPKKRRTQRKKDATEAPEFSKAPRPKKLSKADSESSNRQSSESESKEPHKDNKNMKKRGSGRVKSAQTSGESSVSESTKDNENQEVEKGSDISEKIDLIRRRRKIKEAKSAVEIKKPKLTKEKPANKILGNIPEGLEEDEEIHLLSQIVSESNQKVEEINKTMQETLKSIESQSAKVLENIPSSSKSEPQTLPKIHRPVSRPTRVPRKEVIPQKEKDKTALLRNKLKAIEVFRKGKLGPGFVPKRERNKKLPKADAELSESSDE